VLEAALRIVKLSGVPVVAAVNRFGTDTDAEVKFVASERRRSAPTSVSFPTCTRAAAREESSWRRLWSRPSRSRQR